MNQNLSGKRALVCGSSAGIGFAVAKAFARMGASVTLVARNQQALEVARQALAVDDGQRHEIVVADFNYPEQLRKAMKEYLADGKPVHILVNNTGGPAGGVIAEASTDDFESAFRQHLICNHIMVQSVLPVMRPAGYGRIINIISTSVKQPLKNLGVSNTIRAAVANWSKTLANELAKENITVNNVLPGATMTSRLSNLISAKALRTGKSESETEKEMLHEIPMRRFGQPEEIAAAVAFLASPDAAYITGINIPVDGGRTSCL